MNILLVDTYNPVSNCASNIQSEIKLDVFVMKLRLFAVVESQNVI